MYKKERFLLFLIIAAVLSLAVYIWSEAPRIEIEYSNQATWLSAQDYWVDSDNGSFTIGRSSFDEVIQLFPDGKTLGLSTIYKPAGIDINLTFSEEENILIFAHIKAKGFVTARGIEVGASAEQVIDAYGPDYTWIHDTQPDMNYDLMYGAEAVQNIVFQIRQGEVAKIVIHNDPGHGSSPK